MMTTHLSDLARTVLRRSRSCPAPDPFDALGIQMRLGRLAAEIRRLEHNDGRWARVHHLTAAQAAYDDVLAEACALVGLPLQEAAAPVRRLLAESELRSRGWTW
jgi:hypothetical protein